MSIRSIHRVIEKLFLLLKFTQTVDHLTKAFFPYPTRLVFKCHLASARASSQVPEGH